MRKNMKKTMVFYMALYVAVVAMSPAAVQTKPAKIIIAVQDLKGNGLDQAAAGIISDRLRSECINTGVFRVMERSQMEDILKEQGFQQTGACDDQSCIVEVGRFLGVDRMVAGTVGRVGDFYTISLRMIDVVTGEILFTVNVDYKGSIEDVISRVTGEAALKLAHSAGDEAAKIMIAGKKGDLYITSEPSDALVEIDGKKIDGRTPLTLQGYTAGEHRIAARRNNYFGSKIITLEPDDLLKVDLVMREGEGAVKVFSTPAGADVLLDGENKGRTPAKIDKVIAGEHVVSVQKQGYIAQKTTVTVNIDEIANVSSELAPAAYLSVKAEPSSAAIMVNGKLVATGGIELYEVAAGEVTVQVQTPGFDPYTAAVNIPKAQTRTINVKLESKFGELEITSEPQDAQVFLNGKHSGRTPYANRELEPGSYGLRLTLETYNDITETVQLLKGRQLKREFTFEHTKPYLDSVAAVKAAANKRRQWTRRIVFGVLAAGTGGLGAYFNAQSQGYAQDQQKIQSGYRAAAAGFDAYPSDYNAKADSAKQARTLRNILYGCAGTFAFGLVISIPL